MIKYDFAMLNKSNAHELAQIAKEVGAVALTLATRYLQGIAQ